MDGQYILGTLQEQLACGVPLWKLSSIGGIILYTFPRISFLDAEAILQTVTDQKV